MKCHTIHQEVKTCSSYLILTFCVYLFVSNCSSSSSSNNTKEGSLLPQQLPHSVLQALHHWWTGQVHQINQHLSSLLQGKLLPLPLHPHQLQSLYLLQQCRQMSLWLQLTMALWLLQHRNSSCHLQANQSKAMQLLPFLSPHLQLQGHAHNHSTHHLLLVICLWDIAPILFLLCLFVEIQVAMRPLQRSHLFLSCLHLWMPSHCRTTHHSQHLGLNPLGHRAVLQGNQTTCTMGWVQIHHHLYKPLIHCWTWVEEVMYQVQQQYHHSHLLPLQRHLKSRDPPNGAPLPSSHIQLSHNHDFLMLRCGWQLPLERQWSQQGQQPNQTKVSLQL